MSFILDIDELLKKTHSIKKTLIGVSLQNQLELQLDTIEVTGDDDTETLKFYFGGRRSGGNRTKSVESVTKVGTNVVQVKFESVDGMHLLYSTLLLQSKTFTDL